MELKSSACELLKEEGTRKIFMHWWEGLETNRGGRAQLRRCREPTQVVLHSLFYELDNELPQWPESKRLGLAAIAGLIANVNESLRGLSFPQQLGTPKEQGTNPPMSENRFRQLIKSRDWPEFYVRMRRAILMLNRNVNVLSLVDYIWLFGKQQTGDNLESSKNFQFRMAEEYFKKVLQNVKPSK